MTRPGWDARGPVLIPRNDPFTAAAMLIALCAFPEPTKKGDSARNIAVDALLAWKWLGEAGVIEGMYWARSGGRNKGRADLRKDGGGKFLAIPAQQVRNRLHAIDRRLIQRFRALDITNFSILSAQSESSKHLPRSSTTEPISRERQIEAMKEQWQQTRETLKRKPRLRKIALRMNIRNPDKGTESDEERRAREERGIKRSGDLLIRHTLRPSIPVLGLATVLLDVFLTRGRDKQVSNLVTPSRRLMAGCQDLVDSAEASSTTINMNIPGVFLLGIAPGFDAPSVQIEFRGERWTPDTRGESQNS